MAIRLLRTDDDPLLRKVAFPITRFNKVLQRLIDDMTETMYHYNGVGLAAPQIGISKQLITADAGDGRLQVLVNPEIVARSPEQEIDVEGCLSVPDTYGEVERSTAITVRAQDAGGEFFQLEAAGLLARILQHEIDHLHGILFVDHVIRLVPCPWEENALELN